MEKRKSAKAVFLEQNSIKKEEEPSEPMPIVRSPAYHYSAEQAYDEEQKIDNFASDMDELQELPKAYNERQTMTVENKTPFPNMDVKSSEELQLEKEPIKVRITGIWRWKRVIVPPNAFVVHTRINKKEPITLGQGLSFRYNPYTDAYIVIPAAMQTIGVVANCISKEKQGINVLAYVQWQIEDFAIAYKKLDFNNTYDPLGIVNAQLREQAEAAIKDKIATMSVEEVLTDKAPVIEELTSRLRTVAEGKEGLGIKIITVQIREALVSSTSLWTDLQSPFRNEQKQKARISQLEMEKQIHIKEQETRKMKEVLEAETNAEIEKIKQSKQTESTQLRMSEEAKRYEDEQKTIQKKRQLEESTILKEKETKDRLVVTEKELLLKQKLEELKHNDKINEENKKLALEQEKRQIALETEKQLYLLNEEIRVQKNKQESILKKIETDIVIAEKEAELSKIQLKLENQIEAIKQEAILELDKKRKTIELELLWKENELNAKHQELLNKLEAVRQEIKNNVSSNYLSYELIKELPNIASNMPEIKELKVLQSNGSDPFIENLSSFISKILAISEDLRKKV